MIARDISWGVNCERCDYRMNAGQAERAVVKSAEGEMLLCGACRDEVRLTEEIDRLRAALSECFRLAAADRPKSVMEIANEALTSGSNRG
jgi:triphosphoribosyl-dephospho-CoA synthetase